MTTETKQKPALSLKPPGHWRNVWFHDRAWTGRDGILYPQGLFVSTYRWPSKEVAEEKAAARQAHHDAIFQPRWKHWLRSEHFEDN